MKVRINEPQLQQIIRESVKKALNEGELDNIRQSRFDGLVDMIEFYSDKDSKGKKLSQEQIKQLIDVRNSIVVFGEYGIKWAFEADDILRNNGYKDNFREMYQSDFDMLNEGKVGTTYENLEQSYNLLNDIATSSFIPFTSPNPSGTEAEIKESIIEAMRMISKAKYLCGQMGYNRPRVNVV